MKITRKVFAVATAGLLMMGALSACTSNEVAEEPAGEGTQQPAAEEGAAGEEEAVGAIAVNSRPDECGLQEQEGPTATFGVFDAAIMYFQPGQMAPNPNSDMKMLDYKDSQMHLELDLKANEYATNWGYSVDETPANLHIMYQLSDAAGNVKAKGMMMPMNAIDGSHYGTNLPKDTITEPGKYMMKVTIYPPKNYDIHSDYITGVPATEWFGPLSAEMEWELTQENLDKVAANTVENFMDAPDNCKDYPKKLFEDETAMKNLKAAEAVEPLPMMGH